VCESSFTSKEWIDSFVLNVPVNVDNTPNDIFVGGHQYFIGLATLCELATTTVSDALFTFNQSSLITSQTLPKVDLMSRANDTFTQFTSNTVNEFKRNLALTLSQTATIYIPEVGARKWLPSHGIDSNTITYFQSIPAQIDNCSCALSDECKEPLVIYTYTSYRDLYPLVVQFTFPNMFSSCFGIQSLLQSSLECFFNQTCVDTVRDKMDVFSTYGIRPPENVSILQTNLTRFRPNNSVQELFNEMLIETWGQKIEYNPYYEQCAPKLCSYSFTSRSDAVYVFTTIVGLFGGLSVALKIIVPLIVGWIRNRMRPKVETVSTTSKSS
jgi:hypothetical protein